MSWTELNPIAKITPRAKAYISVTREGVKLHVSFSETLMKELNSPTSAHIDMGSDETFGQIRFRFADEGKFKLSLPEKGGARVMMPAGDGLPQNDTDSFPCEVMFKASGQLILRLPITEWRTPAAKTAAKVTEAHVQTPPPVRKDEVVIGPKVSGVLESLPKHRPMAASNRNSDKLDPIDYLTKKGHRVSRASNGSFLIDGSMSPLLDVLRLVNQHRKESSLPPIVVTDLAA